MIDSTEFPQADNLLQVAMVADAVNAGHLTDEEIEKYLGLSSDSRQGRYYRKAAQILDLIINNHNVSELTICGQEFVALETQEQRLEYLARCLISTELFYGGLNYIYLNNPTKNQLKDWFVSIYPRSAETAHRRFSTFYHYLTDANLINDMGGSLSIQRFQGAVAIQAQKTETFLNFGQFANPMKDSKTPNPEYIRYEVSSQKLEQANLVHWKLVNGKSEFLNSKSLKPFSNLHIDLYTQEKGSVIIYEMKSVNTKSNFLNQIRKAVSQIYEYRYVYNIPDAILSIVTNQPVSKNEKWILDYLAKDRLIAYEWTDDFKNYQCDDESKKLLGNFAP